MLMNVFTSEKKLNMILLATYWAYVSLFMLFVYGYLTDDGHSWMLLVFQCVPLLLVARGLLRKYYRAHSCLCFIILAYFIAYVVEASSPLRQPSDWLGLVLSVIVFCGAMMASRGLQRLAVSE